MLAQAPKVSRWFLGLPIAPGDPDVGALRVTRYLEEYELQTNEGSVRVPNHHVRFSIWVDDHATCVLSISDDEASSWRAF